LTKNLLPQREAKKQWTGIEMSKKDMKKVNFSQVVGLGDQKRRSPSAVNRLLALPETQTIVH
jgi:hypothetical protein